MTQKTRKLFGVLLLTAGIFIFYYLISRVGIIAIKDSLRNAEVSFIACGLVAALFAMIVRAYKWSIALTASMGPDLRFLPTLLIYFLNSMICYFTPMRGGDLLAPAFFYKFSRLRYTKGFSVIIVDRMIEFIVMCLFMTIAGLVFWVGYEVMIYDLRFEILGAILIFSAVLILVIVRMNQTNLKLLDFLRNKKSLQWFASSIASFQHECGLLKSKLKIMVFLTVIAWIIDSIMFYFLLKALVPIRYYEAAMVEFISAGIGVISLIPGGIGTSELSVVFLLKKLGYDPVLATTACVVMRTPMLLVFSLGIISAGCLYYFDRFTLKKKK